MSTTTLQRFELELLGGGTESRYRAMRPEIERMPWGTCDGAELTSEQRLAARRDWTASAFQEYRTAAACAATLEGLVKARAPLDLIAMASRFPLDELVHVELCARLATELGGGTEILYDPHNLFLAADPSRSPLLHAADMVVRFFCVGETASVPLLRRAWKSTRAPLPRAVLGQIVKDEAAHGIFGWLFLDWALPKLAAADIEHLTRAAERGIDGLKLLWDDVRDRRSAAGISHRDDPYFVLAQNVLEKDIIAPLAARGIAVSGRRGSLVAPP